MGHPLNPENWASHCRLCLSDGNIHSDIFEDDSWQKIADCIEINISPNDDMPRKLCDSCWVHLSSWWKFQSECLATNITLTSILEKHKSSANHIRNDDDSQSLCAEGTFVRRTSQEKEETSVRQQQCLKENDVRSAVIDCAEAVKNILSRAEEINEKSSDNEPKCQGPSSDSGLSTGASADMAHHDVADSTSKEGTNLEEEYNGDTDDESPISEEIPNDIVASPACDESSMDVAAVESTLQEANSPTVSDNIASSHPTPMDCSECDVEESTPTTPMNEPNTSFPIHDNTSIEIPESPRPIDEISICHDNDIPAADFNENCMAAPLIKLEPMDGTLCATITSVESLTNIKAEVVDPENDLNANYNLRPRREPTLKVNDEDGEEPWIDDPVVLGLIPIENMTPWKCSPCQAYFSSKTARQAHYSNPVCFGFRSDKFTCRGCFRVFFDLDELAEHNMMHIKIAHHLTVDDLLRCSKCQFRCADPETLKKHSAVHRIIKRRPFKPVPRARPPSREKPRPEPVSELVQQLPGPTRVILNAVAETIPTAPVELSCSLCPKRFPGEDLLYDHRFAYHGIPDERVTCKVCELKFRNDQLLAEHATSHVKSATARKSTAQTMIRKLPEAGSLIKLGLHRCRHCGRTFNSVQDLSNHEAVQHKDPTPHCCRKCTRRFATRSQLLMHHRGNCERVKEKTSNANIREEAIDQSVDLFCMLCKIMFRSTDDFNDHMYKHKISPIICKLKYKSRTAENLNYRYQCGYCPQLFCTKSGGVKHTRTHHTGSKVKFSLLKQSISRAKAAIDLVPQSETEKEMPDGKRREHQAAVIIKQEKETPASSVEVISATITCPHCSNIFAPHEISQHIKDVHGKPKPSATSQRKSYACRYCSKICGNQYNLSRHESCHDPKNPNGFICKRCGTQTKNKAEYAFHQKRCTLNEKAAIVTKNVRPLKRTREMTANVRKSSKEDCMCPICKNVYETPSMVELHIMTVHDISALHLQEKKKLQGSAAPPQSTSLTPKREIPEPELWQLERNKIMREINGRHYCTLCKFQIPDSIAASFHRNQHPRGNLYVVQVDNALYQCTVCNAFFDLRVTALEHAQTHVEPQGNLLARQTPKTYQCPFCNSTFSSEETIRNHIFYVHPNGTSNAI